MADPVGAADELPAIVELFCPEDEVVVAGADDLVDATLIALLAAETTLLAAETALEAPAAADDCAVEDVTAGDAFAFCTLIVQDFISRTWSLPSVVTPMKLTVHFCVIISPAL